MTWDVRSIYEGSQTPKGAWINPEVYLHAFPQEHVIEGHCVRCIFARPKAGSSSQFNRTIDAVNVGRVEGILYVEEREMRGLRRGESLRVDGEVYRVTALSSPVPGMLRAELSGGTE